MKPASTFKIRWVLALVVFLFSFFLVLHFYQPSPPINSGNPSSSTSEQSAGESVVNTIQANAIICLDVTENGKPLGIKTEFGNPDYVFGYLHYIDNPFYQKITFRWKYHNREILKQEEWINEGEGKLWSQLDFGNEKYGTWQLEIYQQNGELLVRIPFLVKGISD